MTEQQRQAALYDLQQEKRIMRQLERSYKHALKQVNERIHNLDERTDEKNKQSIAYQKQFQTAVKNQLEDILKALHAETYETVDDYIRESYTDGIVQTMYQLHADGIPLVMSIPQDRAAKAVKQDTKLSKPLYDSIGEDLQSLKQHITDVISAGFAAGTSVNDMAHQITAKMIGDYASMKGGALGKAKTIARTESNRVANAARLDAATDAKEAGADMVKQWDSTMDRATRPHHVELDGQVRELDEPFEVAGHKAMVPHQFGIASEDVNCRCRVNIRPRWAVTSDLENDRMKMDGETGKLVKIDSDEYREFKALYLKEAENLEKDPENVTELSNEGEPFDGKAVEVDVKTPKDNGGTGKTYQSEKIKHLKGSYSVKFEKVSGSPEITPQLAKEFSDEYDRFQEKFRKLSSVRSVEVKPYENDGIYGDYNDNSGVISIYGAGGKDGKTIISKVTSDMKKSGKWSTSSPYHAFRHELGHALQKQLKESVPDYEKRLDKIKEIRKSIFDSLTGFSGSDIIEMKKNVLSVYGLCEEEELDEFISECVAECCTKKPRKTARNVVNILLNGVDENAG
ncbi:phage minor head protein [Ruminococcus sp.]|uniref:phage minor head protein n=1 Tax=Ruminococcus sp. TaxID=41978 RepID=UPI0025F71F22|nr:phage minor head protein [Ruminococcus sp.]